MSLLIPIVFAAVVGLVTYHFNVWQTKNQMDRQSAPLEDPELGRLNARLAQALDVPKITVHLIDTQAINGLALADGRIFLTRGFLELYHKGAVAAEELASVVAHELGHVALGHANRRMADFAAQNALRVTLTMLISRFIPFVGVYIANGLVGLLGARLSRRDEYEADEYAAALLQKAGIGLAPQISLFEKLDSLGPQGMAPVWLRSHPLTIDRIQAIQKLEKRWSRR